MKELLQLIRKSKTAKSGLGTILVGILILFGITDAAPPQTIDDIGSEQTNSTETVIGLGALLSGAMAVKGRNDVEKRMKEGDKDETA